MARRKAGKAILAEFHRASKLSEEMINSGGACRTGLATHGLLLGIMYTLVWVLGERKESPTDYARRRLEERK